ncbi:MAG: RHS repeat-associated core domain-containing protein, partial [Bacteroidota bacterium]
EFYNHGSPNANSWTRENSTGNNFLANGGTELNTTSSLYDLDFRNFDPILGRMHQVDPMADKYGSATPYNFSFNNPVSLNDPSGADPFVRDDYWREIEMQQRNYRKLGDAVTNQIRSSMSSTHVTHITPGSGGNWADGIYYSDWSLHGGSQMYRNGLAAGLIDVGGKLYAVGPDGELTEAKEENGELGYYETYNDVDNSQTYVNNGVTYRGVPVVGTRFVKVQQGQGVVLNFTSGFYKKQVEANGWHVINANSLESALEQISKYTAAGNNIANLVIHSHGAGGRQLHLGLNTLDAAHYKTKKLQREVVMLNDILSQVASNGNVVFTGCGAGNGLATAMSTNIRCDINVYMNIDQSRGLNFQGKETFMMNTFYLGGKNPNWINLQTGADRHKISVNSNGKIIIK